jgi:hypothetical protein
MKRILSIAAMQRATAATLILPAAPQSNRNVREPNLGHSGGVRAFSCDAPDKAAQSFFTPEVHPNDFTEKNGELRQLLRFREDTGITGRR